MKKNHIPFREPISVIVIPYSNSTPVFNFFFQWQKCTFSSLLAPKLGQVGLGGHLACIAWAWPNEATCHPQALPGTLFAVSALGENQKFSTFFKHFLHFWKYGISKPSMKRWPKCLQSISPVSWSYARSRDFKCLLVCVLITTKNDKIFV